MALRIKEFVVFFERAKMVEQSLELSEKLEPSHVMKKQFGNPSSFLRQRGIKNHEILESQWQNRVR